MATINSFVRNANGTIDRAGLTRAGPVMRVEVHVPPQIATALTSQGRRVPPPGTGLAMIDTGASDTSVHLPVLTSLGLNPSGTAPAGTAAGPRMQNLYSVRLVFPDSGTVVDFPKAADVNLTGQIIPTNPPQQLIVLIGRNFLEMCVFIYNGPGAYWTLTV